MNIYKMLIKKICHEHIQDVNKTPYAMNMYKMPIKQYML
jgi:hypothetical protein